MIGQIRAEAAGGGDIITFGRPALVQSLTNARLVDEYRIRIHPVSVREGKRPFENLQGRTDLRLLGVETHARGAIMVRNAPAASAWSVRTRQREVPWRRFDEIGAHTLFVHTILQIRASASAGKLRKKRAASSLNHLST